MKSKEITVGIDPAKAKMCAITMLGENTIKTIMTDYREILTAIDPCEVWLEDAIWSNKTRNIHIIKAVGYIETLLKINGFLVNMVNPATWKSAMGIPARRKCNAEVYRQVITNACQNHNCLDNNIDLTKGYAIDAMESALIAKYGEIQKKSINFIG